MTNAGRIFFSREAHPEMALARCETCGPPERLAHSYPHVHTPVAPSSIPCGAPTCVRPAFVWLTDEEQQQYLSGQRIFRLNRAVSVQVT